MVYLFVSILFPSDKAPDAGKKFLEQLKKYPNDETLYESLVDAAVKTTEDGIRAVSISRVKKGKLEEAITAAQKYAAEFHDIVGFEYSIEVWFTQIEAYASIGKKPPE